MIQVKRSKRQLTTKALLAFTALPCFSSFNMHSTEFYPGNQRSVTSSWTAFSPPTSSTALHAWLNGPDTTSSIFQSVCSTATNFFCLSENTEAEFFGDMSHITLDLATFLSPNTVSLRLLLFLGRLFSIVSDYLPDHQMSPDEGLFQFFMLGYSCKELIKSAILHVKAYDHNDSSRMIFRHRRIYLKNFYQAGFSWIQYKILLSRGAFEWITLSPYAQVTLRSDDQEECMYLLHRGQVNLILEKEKISWKVPAKHSLSSSRSSSRMNLICDFRSAQRLIDGEKTDRRLSTTSRNEDSRISETARTSAGCLQTGPQGAVLLRMDIQRLLDTMKEDEEISDRIKRLMFLGIQEKLKMLMLLD